MSDEFDDLQWPSDGRLAATSIAVGSPKWRDQTARLLTRLVRGADAAGRARALTCLLKPLSTLSLAAVAAGAFGRYVHRSTALDEGVALADASAYTRDQIQALARFVLDVSPEAVAQVADLLADNPMGMAAFSASALVLLYRRLGPGKTLS